MDLDGKVALVTGAGMRLGAAVARGLAEEGARVAVHYRSSGKAAKALAAKIKGRAFACDFEDARAADLLVGRVCRAMGPPAVLVHNASHFAAGTLTDTSLEEWRRHLDVDLTAPFLLTRAQARALPEDGEGVAVALVDHRALRPGRGHLAYTVAEAGLVALMRGVARAEAPRLRTGVVSLGPVLPPAGGDESDLAAQVDKTPMGRAATLEEAVAAVVHLCRAGYTTGAVLAVDGGRHLGDP